MSSNLNNNDVYFKVAKVIAEQLNISDDKIVEDLSFDNLGADSLDQIEILMKVEELFNIEIDDDMSEKIMYVKDLVNCVNNVRQN